MDYTNMSPREVRAMIRQQRITGPTAGMCAGYAQANLVVLPRSQAYDFFSVYTAKSQVMPHTRSK